MTTRTSFVVLAAALAASLLCGCETVSSPSCACSARSSRLTPARRARPARRAAQPAAPAPAQDAAAH